MKYIDIHTHHPQDDDEIIAIRNFIYGVDVWPSSGYFSAGMHPWYLDYSFDGFEKWLNRVKNNPYFLAVGECGMDFRPEYLNLFSRTQQEDFFLRQVHWAQQHQKPLIIHCVKCFDRLLYLKKNIVSTVPWIIHGFSKNEILARQLLNAGFYLSFGALSVKNRSNMKALKITPVERLFFETDEQTDVNIESIYQNAATVKSLELNDLMRQIEQNFKHVFKVK